MWYPTIIVTPPVAEPVSLAELRNQCSVSEAEFDAQLSRLASVARNHCEQYCNLRWAACTLAMQSDSFRDLDRLPEAPLVAVQSIEYVDRDGEEQQLEETTYQ